MKVSGRAVGIVMPTWLFRRFIARRVVQNPVRLFLLVWAVAVATTLISSVVRVSVAGVESFEEALGYSPQGYPLTITPRGGRIKLDGLGRCLAPLRNNFDIVAYRREVGEISVEGHPNPLAVVGVTGVGGEPGNSGERGSILFSERAIQNFKLRAGDRVAIGVGDLSAEGTVAVNHSLSTATPSLAAVIPLAWFSRGRGEGVIDGILLRPRGGVSLEVARRDLSGWMSTCSSVSVPLQVDTVQTRVQRGESLVAAYRFNVGIMAAMALLVCALLVSQATQLSLRNLSRELSILRTLGVGRLGCLTSVVQESTMIGVIGAVAGVTIGEPITVRITELFLQTAHEIYNLSLGVSGSYHLVERCVVVVGMVSLCVAGAALGGLQALRVAPSIGTRSAYRQAQPLSPAWALALAIGGVVAGTSIGVAAYRSDSTLLAYLFVAGSIVMVVSVTPYVIVIAPRCLTRIGDSLFVWFARGGIHTNGRAFILGATGASVGMTLICALTLMVGSFRRTLDGWAAQRLQGDLFVSAALDGQGNESRVSSNLISPLSSVRGVRRVIPYYETMTALDGQPVMMSASDIEAQLDRGIYVVRAGALDRDTLVSGRGAMVSESAARKLGLRPGDPLTVDGKTFVTVAVIQEFGTEQPLVQINRASFLSLYPGQHPENLTIDLDPSVGVHTTIRGDVERLVGASGIVRDNRELRELVLTLFDRTFRITLSVRWIVFGIALLGLMLAALQHLWERRREIKTMHVLGFSAGEIVLTHVVESTVVCALPVLVGLLGGGVMGWGLTTLVNPRSFGWSLDFSPSLTPCLIAFGFIVGVAVVVGCATRGFLGRVIREATLADE